MKRVGSLSRLEVNKSRCRGTRVSHWNIFQTGRLAGPKEARRLPGAGKVTAKCEACAGCEESCLLKQRYSLCSNQTAETGD
ncbi:hypothetical protein RRG08_051451 [Elysia crispata]|uniref:Uncharacterized protein n=1 Tax=Elysia crispata TaxID=231223 RepID=A0AAE1B409_9GAST|nr:hypothetical protein RRG08_051451 [Elysia crispata]